MPRPKWAPAASKRPANTPKAIGVAQRAFNPGRNTAQAPACPHFFKG